MEKFMLLLCVDEEHIALTESIANAVYLPLKQAGRKLAELSITSELISNTSSISMDVS